eukprot:CAMPEP_0172436588 /NCGR_PEP_ID=MMETSP1064-20121228/71799_1 /TAXON_ID=202472 /ORGANISM="Aulacoseira subarctica , Strain CCAP 1002/5" /LENGTH=143 /DNA_ID=CAMNT_0013185001 /DNA_START=4320 /DNA_END=4751 /DNA_ORIENTATION=-
MEPFPISDRLGSGWILRPVLSEVPRRTSVLLTEESGIHRHPFECKEESLLPLVLIIVPRFPLQLTYHRNDLDVLALGELDDIPLLNLRYCEKYPQFGGPCTKAIVDESLLSMPPVALVVFLEFQDVGERVSILAKLLPLEGLD